MKFKITEEQRRFLESEGRLVIRKERCWPMKFGLSTTPVSTHAPSGESWYDLVKQARESVATHEPYAVIHTSEMGFWPTPPKDPT